MRVAIDVRSLQRAERNVSTDALNGPARYVRGLVRSLLVKDDCVQYVLLVDKGPLPPLLEKLAASDARISLSRVGYRLPVRLLKGGRLADLVAVAEWPVLTQQIHRLNPDVLHLTEQPAPPVAFRPRAITLHDCSRLLDRNSAGSSLARSLMSMRLRQSVNADAVVCDSGNTADDATRLLRVKRDRLIVSYPKIDTRIFRPVDRQHLGRPSPFSSSSYFLHVGVLAPRKNPRGLFEAFRIASERRPGLVLVCTGPYEIFPSVTRALQTLAGELGISSRVRILTSCGDRSLAHLYQNALALVFPSFYEGFGFPVAEALACGTPCVTSNRSSLPEVGGQLAVLVDPVDPSSIADGMSRALDDTELRSKVREVGPVWSAKFSWDAFPAELASLYARLASTTAAVLPQVTS
jgi:glycosyltransferase involved in cell wall biosynthesis